MTVEQLVSDWKEANEARLGPLNSTVKSHLKRYVLPLCGGRLIREFQRVDAEQYLRALKSTISMRRRVLGTGSIHNAFYLLHHVFAFAETRGYVDRNPVRVDRGLVPPITDVDPEWRDTARFDPEEVLELITSTRLPLIRRVTNAMGLLAGVRPGEEAAFRWVEYDPARRPLGQLTCRRAFSSQKHCVKGTKTGSTRLIPVHPLLADLLKAWRETGWSAWVGRPPEATDLILPKKDLAYRSSWVALDAFRRDLEVLGLRSRRNYDRRRTFISMAEDGGAEPLHIRFITHGRPPGVLGKYSTALWRVLCDTVMCVDLRASRAEEEKTEARRSMET
jgi:integrase